MNLDAVLTKRESQITAYLAWGRTKKEVANELGISVRTVENIARSIFEKTGVTKVNELAAFYFCKNFNIPLNLSPVKRTLVIALLVVMLPAELRPADQISRKIRPTTIQVRSIRSRRRDESSYYSNQFIYEN